VEARSDGRPSFAVGLVTDWVQRGLLVAGSSGLRLAPGTRPELPDGIHALWQTRLDALLAPLPTSARVALEVLSALGAGTELAVWREVCLRAGAPLSGEVLPELVERNLARLEADGWSLPARTLAESLRLGARAGGREAGQHELAAEVLAERLDHAGTPRWQRIGEHLLLARRPDTAWDWLMQTADRWKDAGEYGRALRCVERAGQALEQAGVQDQDPRLGETLGPCAALLRLSGDMETADELAEQVARLGTERMVGLREELADRWRRARASALCLRGVLARDATDYATAEEHLAAATGIFGALGDVAGLARAVAARAWMARDRARFHEAELLFEEARSLYEAVGDAAGAATCLEGLADTARRTGEPERAEELFGQAIDLAGTLGLTRSVASMRQSLAQVLVARGELREAHDLQALAHATWERLGAPRALATSHNALGEVLRALGHLREAEEHYRRALALFEVTGSHLRFLPLANLTQMLMTEGLFEDAEVLLAQCEELVRQHQRRSYQVFLAVLRLPCTAAAGAWERWDEELPATRDLLRELGAVDRDVAQALELAGSLAAEAGQPERAEAAWQVSEQQWSALGNEEAAARVARRRRELPATRS